MSDLQLFRNTLTIFDIDDTLFQTSARTKVFREDGKSTILHSSQFCSHQLEPNEYYDFSEYTDAALFYHTSIPIEQIWEIARISVDQSRVDSKNRTVIVTARGDLDDKDTFLSTFEKHGLDMRYVHVFRAGNMITGSTAERKKIIINRLLSEQLYRIVNFYDDQIDNLMSFLSLKTHFPETQFNAFLVKNGQIDNIEIE